MAVQPRMIQPALATPAEDPRAELDRLRKVKRLRELEAKATGATPAQPQPSTPAPRAQAEQTPWGDGQAFEDMYAPTPEQVAARRMNAPNPIDTAFRESQAQATNDWAAQKRAEQAAAERAAQERREASRALGAGMDYVVNEDLQPVIPDAEKDVGKAMFGAPIQFGQGLAEGVANTGNVMFAASTGLGNLALNAVDPNREQSQPIRIDVPRNVIIDDGGPLESVSGIVPRIAGQVSGPRVALGKALPGGGPVAQIAKDAAAFGLGTPQDIPRLADMISSDAPLVGPLADALRTREGDNAFMAFGKNAAEDLLLGSAIGASLRGGAVVLDALGRPRAPVPTNAGGARPGPVTPQPIPQGPPVTAVPQTPLRPQPAPQPAPQPPPQATQPPPQPPRAGLPAPVRASGGGQQPPGGGGNTPPTPPQPPVPATAVSSLGEAEVWFNALPQKTREAILRTFESSGVRDRAEQFAIIADLNSLPAGRNSQNAFLISQKWGERYPSLRENLANIGGSFSATNPRANDQKILGVFGKGRSDRAQAIMDAEGRKQVVSERGFLERSAETNFGKPSADVAQQLKDELRGLGNRYNFLLDPTRKRRFSRDKLVGLQAAEGRLKDFLKQPWIIDTMPDAVKNRLMVDASDEIRSLGWSADDLRTMAGPNRQMLAPLFEASGPLPWSPEMWTAIAEQYPRFAAHVLQSSYAKAARDLSRGINAAENAGTIGQLRRMRGIGDNGEAIPGGLLDQLEKTMPNKDFSFTAAGSYADTRKNWGDVKGAQEAFDITRRFKAAAQSGENVAAIIEEMSGLSPRAKEAALSEITSFVQDSMGAKVRNITPGQVGTAATTAPNLTQLGNDNFLQALRKVFGDRGDTLANDIELARASTTFNTDINRRIGSNTQVKQENVRNAPSIYENPRGLEGNVVDSTVQMASAAGAGAAFTGNVGIAASLAGVAGIKAAWNAYKRGRRLTNTERSLLADFFFRSREAGVDGEALLARAADAPSPPRSPNLPSPVGYGANVLVGAGAGGLAGGASSGGDPDAIIAGIIAGSGAGTWRAASRASKAGKSIIPPRRPGPGGTSPTPPGTPPAQMGLFGGGGRGPRKPVGPAGPPAPAGQSGGRPAGMAGLSFGDYVAAIEAKYPAAGPNQMSPYHQAATAIRQAGGNRDAAFRELSEYADHLAKSGPKSAEAAENARRAAAAVRDVDPIFFDEAAFSKRMSSEIEASGEAARETIRKSTPDDGVAGSIRADERAKNPPPAQKGVPGSGLPMDEASRNRSLLQTLARPGEPQRVADLLAGSPVSVTREEAKEMLDLIRMHLRPEDPYEYGKGFGFTLDELKADPSIAEEFLNFDPQKLAKFQAVLGTVSQEGSSKLLAGMVKPGVPEMGIATAGVGYGTFAPLEDMDGDGDEDGDDRRQMLVKYGMGGLVTGMGVSAAGSLGNRLRSGPPSVPKGPAEMGFGGKRTPREIDDATIERASRELTPGEFEAWKAANEGLSNEQIAIRLGGENGGSTGSVAVQLNGARNKGFPVEKVTKYAGSETRRVVELKAEGLSSRVIGERVYPHLSADEARQKVSVIASKRKDEIEAIRRAKFGSQKPPAQMGFGGGGKGPPKPEVLPPDPYAGPPKRGTKGKAYRMGPEHMPEPPASPKARPKPPAKPMGRTEEVALQEYKAAQREYNRLSNKHVMRDERDAIVEPARQRMIAAEQRLSKVRQTDARYRTFKARVGEILNEPKMTLKGALIGGAAVAPIAGAAILATNALKGGQKEPPAPMSPADPAYYWERVATKDRGVMRQVQGALQEWGFWDDETEQNGNYGRTTKDAIKAWRHARRKDPNKPMSRADIKELLAGPKGYSGDGGEWGKEGEWYYGSGDMVRIPQ